MSTFIQGIKDSWKLIIEETYVCWLEQEVSKKQKTIEEVLVLEESITEPVIAKKEEIKKSIKKRGKIRKQKARKGIHIDKTAQDGSEEEKEAFMKDKVTSASSDSDIGIDAITTATKLPSIVDWKIIPLSGQKAVYHIIRRDGSDKIYMSFGAILKDFSRDDLTELYRLVINKYEAIKYMKRCHDGSTLGDRKTIKSMVWLSGKLYGVGKDCLCVGLEKQNSWSSSVPLSNRHQKLASPKQTTLLNSPDLFDKYYAGIVLMQMAILSLRSAAAL
ncbi:hypothetical protein Tco_0435005 [Tanacetum coccineum]